MEIEGVIKSMVLKVLDNWGFEDYFPLGFNRFTTSIINDGIGVEVKLVSTLNPNRVTITIERVKEDEQ